MCILKVRDLAKQYEAVAKRDLSWEEYAEFGFDMSQVRTLARYGYIRIAA